MSVFKLGCECNNASLVKILQKRNPVMTPSILAALAFPNIDPVLLQLGPLKVHWYGMAYVVGILSGWWYAGRLVSNQKLWNGPSPITKLHLDDFLMWLVAGVILGGRIGYVLFYNLDKYLAQPLDIIKVWDGGMSFHGGLTGVVIAMILFARSRGFSPFSLFDIIGPASCIAIFFGRCANFINQELFGKVTDASWGVIFPITQDGLARHPSQLYEAALEGIVLFIALRILTHTFLKLKSPGFIAGAYVAGYAIARILVEFVRVPDAQIGYLFGGWLTMGMVLSIPIILIGMWSILTSKSRIISAQ